MKTVIDDLKWFDNIINELLKEETEKEYHHRVYGKLYDENRIIEKEPQPIYSKGRRRIKNYEENGSIHVKRSNNKFFTLRKSWFGIYWHMAQVLAVRNINKFDSRNDLKKFISKKIYNKNEIEKWIVATNRLDKKIRFN